MPRSARPPHTLGSLLRSDLERYFHYYGQPGRTVRTVDLWRSFLNPRCLPVSLYRLAHAAENRRLRPLAKLLTWLNFYLHGLEVWSGCVIGSHFFMPHVQGSVIGASTIGDYAVIYHQVTLGAKEIDTTNSLRPIIGDRAFIASGAKIIGSLEIGDDCVVGANAVVTKSCPAGMVLVGVPAIAKPRTDLLGTSAYHTPRVS